MVTFAQNWKNVADDEAGSALVWKVSNIEHFQILWNVAPCGNENQGAHPETDIIRALSYLRCGDRGSV